MSSRRVIYQVQYMILLYVSSVNNFKPHLVKLNKHSVFIFLQCPTGNGKHFIASYLLRATGTGSFQSPLPAFSLKHLKAYRKPCRAFCFRKKSTNGCIFPYFRRKHT